MNPSAPRAEPPKSADLSAEPPHLSISALADGDRTAVERACALWRDDPQARERWHTYHLIGDVLRSEELATPSSRDAAFLAGLRSRLAAEPVLLAPTPQPAARVRHRWLAPAAVAAGFVAVAGVLVVTRVSAPEPDAQLAAAPAATPAASLVSAAGGLGQPLVVEGRLIRDARLDSYLRAHREALGSAPAALPGGAPRNVEMLLPAGSALAPAAASTAVAR